MLKTKDCFHAGLKPLLRTASVSLWLSGSLKSSGWPLILTLINQFCLNPSVPNWTCIMLIPYLNIRINHLPLLPSMWPGNMLPWEDLHGENQDGESGPGEDCGKETKSWSSVILVKSWGRSWWISNAGVSEELRLEDVATSTVSCEHGAVQVVLAVICLVVQGN